LSSRVTLSQGGGQASPLCEIALYFAGIFLGSAQTRKEREPIDPHYFIFHSPLGNQSQGCGLWVNKCGF